MAPTSANEWLNREESIRATQPLIDASCPLIRETLNFGTRVFQAAQKSTAGNKANQDLPLLMSYLHILEMADGVEVLLSGSCVNPTIPLLRSMFESNLGIAYLLEADTEKRSFDWLLAYFRARLAFYESNSPDTEPGQRLLRELRTQPPRIEPNISRENLEQAISNARHILSSQDLREAAQRFAKKRKDWYSASNGPTNLRDLSKHLGRLWDYEVLYRKWSTVVHAVDVSRFLTRSDKGGAAFYALRNPREFASIAFLATAIVLEATRTLATYYKVDLDLKRWYLSEVRERWYALQEMQIEFVEREIEVGESA